MFSKLLKIVSQLRWVLLIFTSMLLMSCIGDHAAPIDNLTYPPAVVGNNTAPKTVVLIVPTQGEFGKEGQMVQAAFMHAYQQSGKTEALKVLTLDSSVDKTPNHIYEMALKENPDLIVGPLTKPDVNALLNRHDLPVATLALNQIDVSAIAPLNLYQFSLSPQADASEVSKKMQRDGFKKALVISPQSTWGQGIATSFGQSWLAANNQIVDSLAYASESAIGDSIKQLFERNANDLMSNTAIVLIASDKEAEKLLPILKQYGKNLPIYALPMIYNGSNQNVLEGIHFAVSPWNLTPLNASHLGFEKTYPNASWREANLYAFGLDAYALAQYALFNSGFAGVSINGQTGYLTIEANSIVQRKLSWVTVQKGQLISEQKTQTEAPTVALQ